LTHKLPPQLAGWLSQTFNVEAYALRDLHLRDAEDEQIFQKARHQGIVIISKDSDFVEMVLRLGAPPQLLWSLVATSLTADYKTCCHRFFLKLRNCWRQAKLSLK